jgi:hypothetical protein
MQPYRHISWCFIWYYKHIHIWVSLVNGQTRTYTVTRTYAAWAPVKQSSPIAHKCNTHTCPGRHRSAAIHTHIWVLTAIQPCTHILVSPGNTHTHLGLPTNTHRYSLVYSLLPIHIHAHLRPADICTHVQMGLHWYVVMHTHTRVKPGLRKHTSVLCCHINTCKHARTYTHTS